MPLSEDEPRFLPEIEVHRSVSDSVTDGERSDLGVPALLPGSGS